MNTAQMLQIVQDVNQVRRKARNPVHPHLIEYRPYQITPFMIAPVLPGETLKNLNAQARVITDPIKGGAGNILPWWCEHYYYYVKVRQLGDTVRSAFENMMLEGVPMGINDPAKAQTYHAGGTIDWVDRCLRFVTENGGFRDDGEDWNPVVGGLPLAAAHRHGQSFLDSLMVDNGGSAPPSNPYQNPHDTDVLAEYQEQYERMRAMRLIDMTFEDWLQTYGVRLSNDANLERPELIRISSEWGYPANTVDPATGLPTGAASFAVNIRADKDRFFKEPGFIFGVTVIRPKVYLGNQRMTASSMMDTPLPWLPRMLSDQPHTSVKEFVGGTAPGMTGPLKNQTAGYWLDTRDLFAYGDQFLNFAGAAGFAPALPSATGEKRFMTTAEIDALFQGAAKNKVRQDGITRLSILSHPTTATDNT